VSSPATRTVGQLVADTIRLYGDRFWRALPLGLSVAVVDQAFRGLPRAQWVLVMITAGAVLLTASYVAAALLALRKEAELRTWLRALLAGWLAFFPVPALLLVFVFPAVAWLALVGLVVPVVLAEELGLRAAFRRAIELARADYIHAFGVLATLVIVYFLTRTMLVFLLRGTGDQTERVAVFLGDLVLAPLLFLGAALLYFDQVARHDEQRAGDVPRR
jgi:hypothetical protein